MARPPALPQLIGRKIYKTGQTRGADDDVIYQNRVSRSSTVLIDYSWPDDWWAPPPGESAFENGFTVLIPPGVYFGTEGIDAELAAKGLELGKNCLVFYQTRKQWTDHPPLAGWQVPTSRSAPIGGHYCARVAGTTSAAGGERIREGFTTSSLKGAGIRLYEYAGAKTTAACHTQLEAVFWSCVDSVERAVENGMIEGDARKRRDWCLEEAASQGLWDTERLWGARILNEEEVTVCPLCLQRISAGGFYSRLAQAAGREVHDLTVTELNLFHIDELTLGSFNHRPYNLGWGHHHCNVVVRDSGIADTLEWMRETVERDARLRQPAENNGS